MHEMIEIDRVPDRQRPVEAVVVLERRDRCGIAGRLLAEVRRGGVRRHELGEDERDERDPEREQHERDEAAEEEASEAAGRQQPAAQLAWRLLFDRGRDGRHSSRAQNGRPMRTSKRT